MTMHRLVGTEACERISWLDPAAPSLQGATGYDVEGWADSVWVLHAMFERDGVSPELTYDQARQHAITSGSEQPLVLSGVNIDEATIATGVPLGFAQMPGPAWKRLRWAELAEREGFELGAGMAVPPCFRWLQVGSWPVRILPPPEGSVDEFTLGALVGVLAENSDADAIGDCSTFFCPVATNNFDEMTVYTGDLHNVRQLAAELGMTPSNLWPADRSWLLYTDWDLMATRVSGSQELIAAIKANDELETVRWQPSIAT